MKVEEIKIALQKNQETHLQFALVDDLKKAVDKMEKGISQLNQERAKMKSIYMNAIDGANTLYSKFGIGAKEIGIDPNSVESYKNFTSIQSMLDDAYYKGN